MLRPAAELAGVRLLEPPKSVPKPHVGEFELLVEVRVTAAALRGDDTKGCDDQHRSLGGHRRLDARAGSRTHAVCARLGAHVLSGWRRRWWRWWRRWRSRRRLLSRGFRDLPPRRLDLVSCGQRQLHLVAEHSGSRRLCVRAAPLSLLFRLLFLACDRVLVLQRRLADGLGQTACPAAPQ